MSKSPISDTFVVDYVLQFFFYGVWKDVGFYDVLDDAIRFCPKSVLYRVVCRERSEKLYLVDIFVD
jgi:hypothetical protein